MAEIYWCPFCEERLADLHAVNEHWEQHEHFAIVRVIDREDV